MIGLYIHIPFCESRCIYCGFYSTTRLDQRQRYVEALCREMELRPTDDTIATIYLGGGTPSMLTHGQLEQLLTHIYNRYNVAPDAEVTLEMNPDDVVRSGEGGGGDGKSPVPLLDGLPVNRVSMGAQTFSAERLRFLRRRHSADEVDKAVELLRRQGIDNISIDLMFGFPGETLADWQSDIAHALALHPNHLSAYSLMYEEGTPLGKLLEQGQISEIDEELSVAMYDELADQLTATGFEHYEISNFALPGRRSRHNSSYWNATPYIGLGAAAHSYDVCTRSWNVSDLSQYMEAVEVGRLPCEMETLDDDTRYDDLVTTRLRTREGIDLCSLQPRHRDYLLRMAKPHLEQGLLAEEDGRLHLTRRGIMVSNAVMSDLMLVD